MTHLKFLAKYLDSLINETEGNGGVIELSRLLMFTSFKKFCDDTLVDNPEAQSITTGLLQRGISLTMSVVTQFLMNEGSEIARHTRFIKSITISNPKIVDSISISNWIIEYQKNQQKTLDQQIATAVFAHKSNFLDAGQDLVTRQIIPANYSRFEFVLRFQRILAKSTQLFHSLIRSAIDGLSIGHSQSIEAYFEYTYTSLTEDTVLVPLELLSSRFKFVNTGNRFTVQRSDFLSPVLCPDWNIRYEYTFNPTIAVGNTNPDLPFKEKSATGLPAISLRARCGILKFQVRLPGQKKGNWIGSYVNLLDARNALRSALALNSESNPDSFVHDESDCSSTNGSIAIEKDKHDDRSITIPILIIGQQIRIYDKQHGLCTGKVLSVNDNSFRVYISTRTNHWESTFNSNDFQISWDVYDYEIRDTRKASRISYDCQSDSDDEEKPVSVNEGEVGTGETSEEARLDEIASIEDAVIVEAHICTVEEAQNYTEVEVEIVVEQKEQEEQKEQGVQQERFVRFKLADDPLLAHRRQEQNDQDRVYMQDLQEREEKLKGGEQENEYKARIRTTVDPLYAELNHLMAKRAEERVLRRKAIKSITDTDFQIVGMHQTSITEIESIIQLKEDEMQEFVRYEKASLNKEVEDINEQWVLLNNDSLTDYGSVVQDATIRILQLLQTKRKEIEARIEWMAPSNLAQATR